MSESLNASKNVAIDVINARTELGNRVIFENLSLQIRAGCFTAIVGPNGAGKSTLLKVMAGVLPHTGELLWGAEEVAAMPPQERGRRCAWLGQSEPSPDEWRVKEVVMLGRLPHQGIFASPSAEDHAAVERSLAATEMTALAERKMSELSGGERQRALLARALATEAPLLLMDEPLIHLDLPHQSDWLRIVRAEVTRGTTVVAVLHELSVALMADEVVVMGGGKVMHHGAAREPDGLKALREAFQSRIDIQSAAGRLAVLPAAPLA